MKRKIFNELQAERVKLRNRLNDVNQGIKVLSDYFTQYPDAIEKTKSVNTTVRKRTVSKENGVESIIVDLLKSTKKRLTSRQIINKLKNVNSGTIYGTLTVAINNNIIKRALNNSKCYEYYV